MPTLAHRRRSRAQRPPARKFLAWYLLERSVDVLAPVRCMRCMAYGEKSVCACTGCKTYIIQRSLAELTRKSMRSFSSKQTSFRRGCTPGRNASGTSPTSHRSQCCELVPHSAYQATSWPIVPSRPASDSLRRSCRKLSKPPTRQ